MAITATFNNDSNNISQLISPLIVKGDSDETTQDNFVYELVIKLGADTIFTGNYDFNPQGVVLANVFKILELVFKPDEVAEFNLPTTADNILQNSDGNNIKYVSFEVSEYYSVSATTSPTKQATDTITKTIIWSKKYAPSLDLSVLIPTSPTAGQFLTESKRTQTLNENEYRTLSFFHGTGVGDYIQINYRDSSGASLGTALIALGAAPTVNSQGAANQYLKTFGAGPANLEKMNTNSFHPSNYPTLSYYEVYIIDNIVDENKTSETFTFKIGCKKGITIRFVNRWGVWDYYTFKQYNKKSVSQTKSSYRSESGDYQGSNYTEPNKRQLTDYNKQNEEQLQVKTDYIDEETQAYLYDLFNSPDVRVIEGNEEHPLNLVNSSYDFLDRENDGLIEIEFTFKYSRRKW